MMIKRYAVFGRMGRNGIADPSEVRVNSNNTAGDL